jgi:putative FmdB family regulatory protein
MPIYEFYCASCNILFNFFARKVDTATVPMCPHCHTPLSREVSQVGYLQGGGDGGEDGLGDVRIDEPRMEKAMESMSGEIESLDDTDDPKKTAEFMKKFSDASGLSFNSDIRNAIDRMASGENPDKVSEDLDAMMISGKDPFAADATRKKAPPVKDPMLYDL